MIEKYDPNINLVIGQIYALIEHWYNLEKTNTENGTEYERLWMETVTNFDFSGLAVKDADNRSMDILNELFTASEQCFIPNRMKLIAAQIVERYGQEFIDLLNERLEYSLQHLWNIEKKKAKELITQFPCLWMIHVVQGFRILSSFTK